MAINNKTLSSIQGKVTGLTTNETDFREGIDDTLVQVNATEVLLQPVDSADITKLSEITATSSELNILDGVTASTSEINILDGVTATTAELNLLDGVTATTAEINILDGLTVSKTELNKLDGFTGTYLDLNKIAAVTATATELNKLDGFTGNAADLNRTVELDAAGNGSANQVLTSDGSGGYTWTTPSSFTFTLEDEDGTEVSIDTDEIKIIGDGMTIDWGTGDGTDGNPYQLKIDNTDKGSSQNIFKNILVSGQSNIVADSNNDSLTVASGTGITITTNATTDTITFGINSGSITNTLLATDSVTTVKIEDSSVTTAKLANTSVSTAKIIDSAITTDKIADGAVTSDKLNVPLGTMASQNSNNVAITGGNIAVSKVDTTTETPSGYGVRVRRASSNGNAIIQFTDNAGSAQLATLVHDGSNLSIGTDTGDVFINDELKVSGSIEVTRNGYTGVGLRLSHGSDIQFTEDVADTNTVLVFSTPGVSNSLQFVDPTGTPALLRAGGMLGDFYWNGSIMAGRVGAKLFYTTYPTNLGQGPSGTVPGSSLSGQPGTWQVITFSYDGKSGITYYYLQRIS
jgi:hypothetical protein